MEEKLLVLSGKLVERKNLPLEEAHLSMEFVSDNGSKSVDVAVAIDSLLGFLKQEGIYPEDEFEITIKRKESPIYRERAENEMMNRLRRIARR